MDRICPKIAQINLFWPVFTKKLTFFQRPLSYNFCKFLWKYSPKWTYLGIFSLLFESCVQLFMFWQRVSCVCSYFIVFIFMECPRRTGNVFGLFFHHGFSYFLPFFEISLLTYLVCAILWNAISNLVCVPLAALAKGTCLVCAARCARYGEVFYDRV